MKSDLFNQQAIALSMKNGYLSLAKKREDFEPLYKLKYKISRTSDVYLEEEIAAQMPEQAASSSSDNSEDESSQGKSLYTVRNEMAGRKSFSLYN